MCFRSIGVPDSLLLLGQVLTAVKGLPGGHRGAAGVWERALGVQLQPQACVRRRRAEAGALGGDGHDDPACPSSWRCWLCTRQGSIGLAAQTVTLLGQRAWRLWPCWRGVAEVGPPEVGSR